MPKAYNVDYKEYGGTSGRIIVQRKDGRIDECLCDEGVAHSQSEEVVCVSAHVYATKESALDAARQCRREEYTGRGIDGESCHAKRGSAYGASIKTYGETISKIKITITPKTK